MVFQASHWHQTCPIVPRQFQPIKWLQKHSQPVHWPSLCSFFAKFAPRHNAYTTKTLSPKKTRKDIVLKCLFWWCFWWKLSKYIYNIYCNWKHGTLKVENILNVADCHVASTNWLQNCLTVKHAYSTHMHCGTKKLHASKTQNCAAKTKTSSHNRFDLYCVAHPVSNSFMSSQVQEWTHGTFSCLQWYSETN